MLRLIVAGIVAILMIILYQLQEKGILIAVVLIVIAYFIIKIVLGYDIEFDVDSEIS